MDIAWEAQEGGEFQDEYESNLDQRAVPFLTVRDMADEDAFNDKVRHKNSTVRRRMTQPYGPMMTDTLLSNGLPPPGTAGDPNAPPPERKVLMYKPLETAQHRAPDASRGAAAYTPPQPSALNPHDSVTQAYANQQHQRAAVDVPPLRYSDDDSSHGSGRSRRSYGSRSSGGSSGGSRRGGGGALTTMYRHALREQTLAAQHARRENAAYDDDDDDGADEAGANHAAPGGARGPPQPAATRLAQRTDFENMGTATLLEAGPVYSAPGTRATLTNLTRRMAKQRRRVQSKRRRRQEATGHDDAGGVSDTSSIQRAQDRLREMRAELEQEERVQYLTYLREAHADGLCGEPRDDASAMELRCTFEAVVCNRERIVRVNRAMMVMVVCVFLVELAVRVFGLPVRVRGLGVFFQRALQTGDYDEFLERVYETTLSSYSWSGTWETVFTIGSLLLGFMMAKYLGGGDKERPAPFGPKGLMVPPELDGEEGKMNDVLDTLGGMSNVTSLYKTFQSGTWSSTGRRAAPSSAAFETSRSAVQGGSDGGRAPGAGPSIKLPSAGARRGGAAHRAAQRPVAKAGQGPVTAEPPSSDDEA